MAAHVQRQLTNKAANRNDAATTHAREKQTIAAGVQWTNVLRTSFSMLLIAYPGVSLKIMQLFKVNLREAHERIHKHHCYAVRAWKLICVVHRTSPHDVTY